MEKRKLVDTAGEGESGTNWESRTDLHMLHVGNRQLVGSCRIEQGAEPGALW